MLAARLLKPLAACGFAVAVALGLFRVLPTTAQTPPSTIGVLVDQVLALFPKVDGDVVEVQGSSVTLSLGKKDGIASGVELSVYREGRELRHPRTGALLGKTEQTLGRIRIEQVFETYAVAAITQGTDVKPGDRARVSAGKVPLTVVPLVENVKDTLAEAAVQALVEGLNHSGRFQVAMGDAIGAGLVQEGLQRKDILEGKGLTKAAERLKAENVLVLLVKSVDKKPFLDVRLFSFPGPSQMLTTGLFVPSSVRPPQRGDFSASDKARPNQTAVPTKSLLARLLTGELDSGAYSSGEGSIPLKEIAKFPFVVLSLDVAVAPADKTPRMVITDGQKVYLYRIVERVLEPEWTWTADATAAVFSVQLADLDGDGAFEVVVNRYHPNPGILVNSLILGTRDGKPVTLVKDVNQILLAVDTTGDGVKRALWAQDFSQTGFWKAGLVDRVALREKRLVQEARVTVPSSFRVTGATMANIGGKNAPRALSFVDEYSRLRVAIESEEVWRSASPVGGGVAKMPIDLVVGRATRTKVYVNEVNPVAIDLDGDGIDEIVVPQNQMPGRLAVIFKGPGGYRFQSINSGFEGTITGLGVIPGDPTPSLVVAVTRYYGLVTSAGDTQIIMTIPE
jgi:hypothetical protein